LSRSDRVIFDAPNTFVVRPFARSRFGAISDDEADSSNSTSLCRVKHEEQGGARAKGGRAGTDVPCPPPQHSLYTGPTQARRSPQQVKMCHYPPKPATDMNTAEGQIGPLTCLNIFLKNTRIKASRSGSNAHLSPVTRGYLNPLTHHLSLLLGVVFSCR
jgi:hypothetical protein